MAAGLTGAERFSVGGTVADFWSYALGDLRSNAARGWLAEYLVARAVGATHARVEWDAYDVTAPDGTRIEVKATGAAQSWARTAPAALAFGGLPGTPRRAWSAESGSYVDDFVADVYVFAVHGTAQDDPYDALDVSDWEFFVLPGQTVVATGQKSMRLSTVRTLGATSVAWEGLARAVREAARQDARS